MDCYGVAALLLWLLAVAPWLGAFWDVAEYMDEIFHAPQTQKYCEGRFGEWDPKITTFPGLYLFAAAAAAAVRTVAGAGAGACSLRFLRGVNVLFGGGCLLLLQALLKRQMSSRKAAAHALVLALYPIHFFYTFLYYTDVGSLFWVLLTHHLAAPEAGKASPSPSRIAAAAASGLVAVGFRQTNAIWVVFTFGTAVLSDLQASPKWSARLRGERLTPTMLVAFATGLLLELRRLLWRFGLLLVPPAFFVAFVLRNGSVVVGDHSNHQAVVHWAQLAYLSAVVASLWGVVGREAAVSPAALRDFAAERLGGLGAATSTLAATAGLAYLLHRYSLAHPFLLADNRHYTFYVWNRFLGRVPWLKEGLAPFYLYAGWFCHRALCRARSPLWALIWWVACALTLVPAHLVEPRYWTTAVVIAHAHAGERSWASLAATAIAFAAVNCATLAIFCFRPFQWPNGEVARFMW